MRSTKAGTKSWQKLGHAFVLNKMMGVPILLPKDLNNEDDFIDRLFELDRRYQDNIDYEFFPNRFSDGNRAIDGQSIVTVHRGRP